MKPKTGTINLWLNFVILYTYPKDLWDTQKNTEDAENVGLNIVEIKTAKKRNRKYIEF